VARGPGLRIAIGEKRFPGNGTPLFSDFSLDIAPGTVVALIGPSGVGKSTLLRLIAGIDRDLAGNIKIDGLDPASAPPPGFVFQDSRLLPWLTARDNVRAVRPRTAGAEADALLARVGLAADAGAFPRQLSGGMQRRVALARALSVNPRLLLLDEPFVSLDRALVAELQALLAALFDETGSTAILVSHVAEDAAALADRAIVLTGRPARITADIAFDIPRRDRDPVARVELTAKLSAAMPG
jgi:NitT/TauT family transport system ATP-binding protein/sulfonate transport system ATP-binding protein